VLRASAPADEVERLFFVPVEPFVVEDSPDRKHLGRISRDCLHPIWQWVSEDLVAKEAKTFSEQVGAEISANEAKKAVQLAYPLQDRALLKMQQAIAEAQSDDKMRQQLAFRIGTPQALNDIREVIGILKVRDALNLLSSRLPESIKSFADDELNAVKALLDSPIARHKDIFTYGLLLVMNRLSVPSHLIRLAIQAANSDKAEKVAKTPFSVAVAVVLDESERLVWKLRTALKSKETSALAVLIKDIHDTFRTLRTEMDMSGDTPWARQLSILRTEVSELLTAGLEKTPGLVRRLLKPRSAKDIVAQSVIDASDVTDADAAVELAGICRNYASELAINEMSLRVYSDLQSFLDSGTTGLLEALKVAGAGERPFRVSQLEAAVQFCARIFGEEYAAVLAKAVEAAAHGKNEPKSAEA
jgi:hypothetical protein